MILIGQRRTSNYALFCSDDNYKALKIQHVTMLQKTRKNATTAAYPNRPDSQSRKRADQWKAC